ncbi:MAG: FMN-binding protein [Treponema sp.]|nr:FMN-binding protein [Treponema sp.]
MSGKKNFSAMLKLGLILAAYSAAACVGLAFVYSATSEIISRRQAADLDSSLRELFPEAENFVPITDIKIADPMVTITGDPANPENTGAFAVLKNNNTIGVALKVSRASYGGPIIILVGTGTDGRIRGVKILEHSDTPGLGANAASKTYFVDRANGIRYYEQFKGKAVGDSFVPRQDVAGITAATITSAAVSLSVKAAGTASMDWIRSGEK